MHCPNCKSANKVKSGFNAGKQRYKCKSCGCNYTQSNSNSKPNHIKKQALHMYLEGLGFRSIGRILGVSNVAVLKWVRKAGDILQENIGNRSAFSPKVAVMELDEMWHFIQKKTIESGCGWLLIEMPQSSGNGRSEVVTVYQESASGKK
jgi:transposase-like protein